MKIPDFKDRDGKWVQCFSMCGKNHYTYSGARWRGLLNRCNPEGWAQKESQAYKGVTNGFNSFQHFAEWSQQQTGSGNFEYQLDKDILFPSSKVYSPSNCVYVPPFINKFFVTNQRIREQALPPGVTWHKTQNKYHARCSDENSNQITIGAFRSVEEAFSAYIPFKMEVAKRIADMWESKVDYRVVEALRNYNPATA